MDCRHVNDLLPLLRHPGLPQREREDVTEHLEGCPGCRALAVQVEADARTLRRRFSSADDGAPGAEEIRELLPPRPPVRPRRRLLPLAAAAVLVVIVGIGWILHRPNQPVTGPSRGEAQLPRLTVPPSPGWKSASRRVVITVVDGKATAKLEYEPADGGKRVRVFTAGTFLPPPKGQSDLTGVSILVVADADELWSDVVRSFGIDHIRNAWAADVYLGGRDADGHLGGLSLDVRRPSLFRSLGAWITPTDIGASATPGSFFGLMVDRTRKGIQYHWGDFCRCFLEGTPWEGDRTFSADEVRRAAAPILPGFAQRLATTRVAWDRDHYPRCMVDIMVGPSVRYLDVLRAVECGHGSPHVYFLFLHCERVNSWLLPTPQRTEDAGALVDAPAGGPALLVFVRSKGPLGVVDRSHPRKAKEVPVADLPRVLLAETGPALHVLAAFDAPWSICRKVIEAGWSRGFEVDLGFFTGVRDRYLRIRKPRKHTPMTILRAIRAGKTLKVKPPAGNSPHPQDQVWLEVPKGATAGEVFPLILKLRHLGVKAFAFE